MTRDARRVLVGLDPALTSSAAEIKYTLRTLLRIAGLPYEFFWADDPSVGEHGLYYGLNAHRSTADVAIHAVDLPYVDASRRELERVLIREGTPYLEFLDRRDGGASSGSGAGGQLVFDSDIVFASFWLLTGAGEPFYRRGRSDLIDLEGAPLFEDGLLAYPAVSIYGNLLRQHFVGRGFTPLDPPWIAGAGGCAFALTHDVDYPEIVRSVECLRLLQTHGLRGIPAAANVLRGTSHFWTFAEWLEFARRLGARTSFYFMSRRGSFLEYAKGTPDAFYDIRSRKFRDLIGQLRDAGCEIGLHTSYHAHRSVEQMRCEKSLLEEIVAAPVEGNRHHYFHLDPQDPQETLLRHQQAGFGYDSSLVLDGYPGFRRGICHPFRPYHPGQRRELDLVEVAPSLIDDHFGRRQVQNRVADADACARGLLDQARACGGVIVAIYHERGMNAELCPRYGPWLSAFAERNFDATLTFPNARDIACMYREFEAKLDELSLDRAQVPTSGGARGAEAVEFAPMRKSEIREVARLHHEFFGTEPEHGASVAKMGVDFLEEFFYGLNFDNPYFFVDVARYRGSLVGFTAFTSDATRVSGWLTSNRLGVAVRTAGRYGAQRPLAMARYLLGNLRFATGVLPRDVARTPALLMLIGVTQEGRSREFRERTGVWVARALLDRIEATLRAGGKHAYCVVVGARNQPMQRLVEGAGARQVLRARVQGVESIYYLNSRSSTPASRTL